jgi:alpha-1,6-mannosyltransferase
MAPYLLPILAYLLLYSVLPHKELRFIFPALPILNMCAGFGMAKLWRSRAKVPYIT